MKTVKFTAMKDGDKEDYDFLTEHEVEFAAKTGERLLDALVQLDEGLSGYKITRLGHSLQAATRAWRDGADTDWIACALLHDIGDTLGSFNHPDIAAAILKPFVSEENLWMVQQHGVFQGYNFFHHIGLDRNLRDQFRSHPHYERTAEFVELFDNAAFDPAGETLPLSEFEPMLRRLMAAPKQSIYKAALERPAAAG